MDGFIKTHQHADGAPGILLPSCLFSLLPQLLKCCVGVQVPGISLLYTWPLLRSRYSGVFNVYISIGVSLLVYGSTSTLPCTCKRKRSSCFKMWLRANLHPAPLESEHCKLGSSLKLWKGVLVEMGVNTVATASIQQFHLIFVMRNHFCAKNLGMTRQKFNDNSVSLSGVHLYLICYSFSSYQGMTP